MWTISLQLQYQKACYYRDHLIIQADVHRQLYSDRNEFVGSGKYE